MISRGKPEAPQGMDRMEPLAAAWPLRTHVTSSGEPPYRMDLICRDCNRTVMALTDKHNIPIPLTARSMTISVGAHIVTRHGYNWDGTQCASS